MYSSYDKLSAVFVITFGFSYSYYISFFRAEF